VSKRMDKKNIILIVEDSFRRDHLGCYGNEWIKTPSIDEFALDSIIFDSAYAEGLPTIPARIALFTGRYTLPFRGWQPLEQLDFPIAEILWDKNVFSALISDTYHMHKPKFGFGKGFDYVKWIRGQELDPWIADPNTILDSSKYSEMNWNPAYPGQPKKILKKQFEKYLKGRRNWEDEENHHIARVMKSAENWIRNRVEAGNKERFFLVIDSFDPHEPWDPPYQYLNMYPVPEYDGLPITWGGGEIDNWSLAEIRHIRAQYSGTITLSDKWTGIFLEVVEELGLLENTLIIFLADHGEPLGEHGIIKKVKPWPYDELSHIPLIMRFPDSMKLKNKRISSFVGLQDIAPTILNLFGVKIPSLIQGENLLPIITEEKKGNAFGISGYNEKSWSIRNKEWSYYLWLEDKVAERKINPELYRYNPEFVPPEPAKYMLREDQAEIHNVICEYHDTARLLDRKIHVFFENLSPSPGDLMAKDYMKRKIMMRTN
jgi:arylsulfatase A-like enzyme